METQWNGLLLLKTCASHIFLMTFQLMILHQDFKRGHLVCNRMDKLVWFHACQEVGVLARF